MLKVDWIKAKEEMRASIPKINTDEMKAMCTRIFQENLTQLESSVQESLKANVLTSVANSTEIETKVRAASEAYLHTTEAITSLSASIASRRAFLTAVIDRVSQTRETDINRIAEQVNSIQRYIESQQRTTPNFNVFEAGDPAVSADYRAAT